VAANHHTDNGDPDNAQDGLTKDLCAILAADAAGYTRLMAADELATIAALERARALFRREIEARGGRVIDMAGDSVLAVFGAATPAVEAAVGVQQLVLEQAAVEPAERRLLFRIGVHLGDIILKSDGTVYGDGVNVAARLQSIAPPGGVAVSHLIPATIGSTYAGRFRDLGERALKGFARPMHVLLVHDEGIVSDIPARDIPATAPAPPGNLPLQSTSILGREGAVAELTDLLRKARLVTLLGMGGLGKTRLAIETAARAAAGYPDGAWFVDLAAVTDAEAVAPAVAGVFGVAGQAGKSVTESVVDALRARRLLIVLDNCEHVTRAAAAVAHAILGACPRVTVLATSRELLRIVGEQVWPIAPLAFDGDTAPAVQLFAERARAVAPDFVLGEQGDVVARLCQALDGIPLAIELAAARVRAMSPAQILERISHRFRLLTGGARGTPNERHQTLRNAVQWSFDFLTPAEQAVVTRAALFAGGFSLEAAEEVCADADVDAIDVCDLLSALVNKSLLHVERRHGDVRFAMLETIRGFCLGKLEAAGELGALRRRHAAFFARQSDLYFDLWRSPREGEAYAWLDLEINNLRDAFRWCCENGDIDSAARIASDVGDMGRFRLREEAAHWAEQIVAQARQVRHPRLAVLLTWCASSAWAFGRFDEARRFGEEALALRDVQGALDLLRAGAEHPTDRRDRFMLAFYLYILATAGFAEQAARLADAAVPKVDAAGVPMSIAVAHGAKGAALEATDPTAALAAYEHAVQVARQAGTRFMEALIAPRVAALHARTGEPMAALSAWRASLVVLLAKLGRYEASATLNGTFAHRIDASGVVPELPHAVARTRAALGEDAFAAATARGAAKSLREASDFAIEQIRLALDELAAGPDAGDDAAPDPQ